MSTPITLPEMTRDERSLLLYLETCAVDQGGRVVGARMNEGDLAIAKRWNEGGLIEFGRRPAAEIMAATTRYPATHVVKLSEAAWALAHEERRARAARMAAERAAR